MNNPDRHRNPAPSRRSSQRLGVRFLPTLVLLLSVEFSQAGSATWNLNPTTGDWNTATNWTPNTVPDGQADTATFSVSNHPAPSLSEPVQLSEIVFAPGASAFTINFQRGRTLNLYGVGVTNNSGLTQKFVLNLFRGVSAQLVFHNNASAGDGMLYRVQSPYPIPGLFFLDNSSAGSSTLVNNSTLDDVHAGDILFSGNATAAEATIINNGGLFNGGQGDTDFLSSATAGTATIIAHGGTVGGALGGSVSFGTGAHAGDATLIADGGAAGADGGAIVFFGVATGDSSRIELFDNATLNNTNVTSSVTIGSLEGNGTVLLGASNLAIGSNNLSTTFAGIIQDTGSLKKIGQGILTLAGANTYTGGTTVAQGTLLVRNSSGSGTGAGPVQINNGTLAGSGSIAGAVTVGTAGSPRALLAPGSSGIGTLTLSNSLHCTSEASYRFGLNSNSVVADEVIANGVTIDNAEFAPSDTGGAPLPTGTIFTAINNTAATPIVGNFSNLRDGSTITIRSNTFQANYEGGDGNDLTLTVLP